MNDSDILEEDHDREIDLNDVKAGLKEDKEDELKDAASAFELHNCIIFQGSGDFNTVINHGAINGNISQNASGANTGSKSENSSYNFCSKKGILEFIRDYRQKEDFLLFVSVAFLGCVPDFLWNDIRISLRNELAEEEEGSLNSSPMNQSFISMDDRLALLHMTLVQADCKTYLGKVNTKCIVFFDDKIRQNVEKTIWEQDYALRNKILSWLMHMKKDNKIGTTMGYQIASALSGISVFDWMYFQEMVFLPLLLEKGNNNRNYLVNILTYVLKEHPYQESLDQKIQEWICRKDTFLWEIAYRLYGVNPQYTFHDKVNGQLEYYLEQDWKSRCLGNGRYRIKRNSKVDIYPAYYNKELRGRILITLMGLYKKCDTYAKKDLLSDYFIWLLTEDYKMEGYPRHQLIFVDALNEKEVRLKVREMYWDFWSRYKVRNVWEQILENHFMELERMGRSWRYMERFFQTIAFTGKAADYEMTRNSLSNMRHSRKTAEDIKKYLSELLQQRRG